MIPWTGGEPKNFAEFFQFYHDYIKSLYSAVQVQNALPSEVLFELNAALDHIARHWTYQEEEARVVGKAYSHCKRACLDIFKIKLRETRKQYDELLTIDTSVIDNGDFDSSLRQLWHDIKTEATEARRLEGRAATDDDTIPLFEPWEKVFVKCERLGSEYYLHPKIEWAKKRAQKRSIYQRLNNWIVGFILGVCGSILASVLYEKFLR